MLFTLADRDLQEVWTKAQNLSGERRDEILELLVQRMCYIDLAYIRFVAQSIESPNALSRAWIYIAEKTLDSGDIEEALKHAQLEMQKVHARSLKVKATGDLDAAVDVIWQSYKIREEFAGLANRMLNPFRIMLPFDMIEPEQSVSD